MSDALAEPTEIDRFEAELAKLQPVECPLVHSFTPGVYVRQIFMAAGSGITSREHKTRHHFIILKGEIAVVSGAERIIYKAPHIGITEPGTRRALYAIEDTVWLTIHANPEDCTDPVKIGKQITTFNNPLLSEETANAWKTSPELFVISGIESRIEERSEQ